MEYATHRLLWSWYSRDRDAQTGPPAWDRFAPDEQEPDEATDCDDETESGP
jgi:hypothetical protein